MQGEPGHPVGIVVLNLLFGKQKIKFADLEINLYHICFTFMIRVKQVFLMTQKCTVLHMP